MTFHRRSLTAVAVALFALAQFGLAAGARAADPATRAIPANVNDAGIDPARGQNLVWLAADEHRRVGKLLVFLPLGAAMNVPTEFEEIGSEAGRLGYHTIVLAYKNEVPIAAPAGCGNGVAPPPPPALQDCAIKARMEILDGREESTVINVDRANSIENRLNKLLEHLAETYPGEGWSEFRDLSGTEPAPNWSEIVIAGGSLGAGQAALIGNLHSVHRVALFSGWADARHGWVKLGMTLSDRYAALIHLRDQFFPRMCDDSDPNVVPAYLALRLVESCPLPDFTVPPDNPLLAENRELPFDTPLLVFNITPTNQPVIPDPFHPSTVRDGYLAREMDGTPSQKLLNAWRSVLGDSDADTWLDDADNCQRRPNPELNADGKQLDTDRDLIGDACDDTPRGTAPTIIVPGHTTVDATGPAGATVTYTATATDDLDAAPTVNCAPLAGTVFPIGDTVVECSSTDSLGNTANASFGITVLGAKEQLSNLISKVIDSTRLPPAVKTQLTASLRPLVAGFDPSKPLQRAAACLTLRVFNTLVRFVAPAAQASEWTADANRIRAVLGC